MSTKTKKSTPKASTKSPKAIVKTTKAVKNVKVNSSKNETKNTPKAVAPKKAKKSNRVTVSVIQYTVRGRRIKKFNSIADAQRATGVNTGSISKVVRGICKTAGGYRWGNA